jgi:hypothetical protein
MTRTFLATVVGAAFSRDRSRLRRADALVDLPDDLRRDGGVERRDLTTRLERRVRFGLPI